MDAFFKSGGKDMTFGKITKPRAKNIFLHRCNVKSAVGLLTFAPLL